jgi:hypothetical protein
MKDYYKLTLEIHIGADPSYSPDWLDAEAQLAIDKVLQGLKNPVFEYLHYTIKVANKQKIEPVTKTPTHENK